jgi:hypothetical protein
MFKRFSSKSLQWSLQEGQRLFIEISEHRQDLQPNGHTHEIVDSATNFIANSRSNKG